VRSLQFFTQQLFTLQHSANALRVCPTPTSPLQTNCKHGLGFGVSLGNPVCGPLRQETSQQKDQPRGPRWRSWDSNQDDQLLDDGKTLGECGFTSQTARPQAPATVGLAFRADEAFEALRIEPFSSPPELPDVMKPQDSGSSANEQAVQ
uniref:Elongin B n=1 Tax=Equus asinus TaxID=9793 RepID=A0A9L0ID32_EQUAS